MITSEIKRIRRDYAPLTVACVVRCLTPASPIGQVYNSATSEYEPNRSLTPTTIFPDVRAGAKDGSWKQEQVNDLLTSMVWTVDGVDITTISDWSGLYEITSSGSNKGALTIKKNVPSGTRYVLSFSAEFADTRLGVNVQVRTEDIILTTTDKGDDNYSLGIDVENDIKYDVTRDMLELYEYQVAHGITPTTTRAAAIATNESYLRTINFTARKGTEVMTSGYYIRVYELSGTTETFRTFADGTPIIAYDNNSITFDLRLIKKADYVIKMAVDGDVVAKVQVSVDRIYPTVFCAPSNGTAILVDDRIRVDKAMVTTNGQKLECPCRAVAIQWKVNSAYKTAVAFNEGETTSFELTKTGIGDTEADNWLDVYTEYALKEEYSVAADSSGNIFTDSDGTIFIFR
jgi:hypothetical protein